MFQISIPLATPCKFSFKLIASLYSLHRTKGGYLFPSDPISIVKERVWLLIARFVSHFPGIIVLEATVTSPRWYFQPILNVSFPQAKCMEHVDFRFPTSSRYEPSDQDAYFSDFSLEEIECTMEPTRRKGNDRTRNRILAIWTRVNLT